MIYRFQSPSIRICTNKLCRGNNVYCHHLLCLKNVLPSFYFEWAKMTCFVQIVLKTYNCNIQIYTMQTLSFSWTFWHLFRLRLKQIRKLKTIHMKPEANVSTKQTFTNTGKYFGGILQQKKTTYCIFHYLPFFDSASRSKGDILIPSLCYLQPDDGMFSDSSECVILSIHVVLHTLQMFLKL